MSAGPVLQVIHEPAPLSGVENMRIDAQLLDRAATDGTNWLRFYQWSEPTVSLGYFQRDSPVPVALANLPIVTRLSGGGAILHHHELTYSISLSKEGSWARNPRSIYQVIHTVIVGCLAGLGLECSMRGDAMSDPENKTFLCFSRSDPHDVVHGEYKVVGSAQRRRRGAVLQHGSVLLNASKYAPDLPGIFDLGARQIEPEQLSILMEGGVTTAFEEK